MTRVILIRERHPPNTKFDWKYCPAEYQPHYFEQNENPSSYKSLLAGVFISNRRKWLATHSVQRKKLRSLFALCTFSQQVNDRWSLLEIKANKSSLDFHRCRDRLVVRTLRCGRSNPGSNPGHGTFFLFVFLLFIFLSSFCKAMKYLFQDELCEIQKQKRHHLKTHCCLLFLFFNFNLQFFGSGITNQIHNVNTKRLQILHHNDTIAFCNKYKHISHFPLYFKYIYWLLEG